MMMRSTVTWARHRRTGGFWIFKLGTVAGFLNSPSGVCQLLGVPRVARFVVPGCRRHITQRGNNRQDVFFTDDDRRLGNK